MNNIEESIFQKQTDNTCIRLLKISKIGILKCDELVLQDMQEIVIKMYDILCIDSYSFKHDLNLDLDKRKKKEFFF